MPDVVRDVVEHGWCIGCGVCLPACPQQALRMARSEKGYLEAGWLEESGCTGCGICLHVCPFGPDGAVESSLADDLFRGAATDPVLGRYRSTFVGHVTDEEARMASASGGMVTWLLQTMLTSGHVDAVLAVGQRSGDGGFEYVECTSASEVAACAGSAYVQVSVGAASLKKRDGKDKRYALVGLPCVLKGVRLLLSRLSWARERIVVLVGLTCGHTVSIHFLEYLLALAGGREDVEIMRYREKDHAKRADGFGFMALYADGQVTKVPFERWSTPWTHEWFSPWACDVCDDVFAELADVTCMDAWLPRYLPDPRGTSLVVCRTQYVEDLLTKGGMSGELEIAPISPHHVVESQEGISRMKRDVLAARLYAMEKEGRSYPRKRVQPDAGQWRKHHREVDLLSEIKRRSVEAWHSTGKDPVRLEERMADLDSALTALRRRSLFSRAIRHPMQAAIGVLRRIGRMVCERSDGRI